MSNIILTETSEPNFCDEKGNAYLVRCPNPECKRENYAMNVAIGICTWCGYDLNKTKIIENETK
jgi:hypothetical protein